MKTKKRFFGGWIVLLMVLVLAGFYFRNRPAQVASEIGTGLRFESPNSKDRLPASAAEETSVKTALKAMVPVAVIQKPAETPRKPSLQEVQVLRSQAKSALAGAYMGQKAFFAEYGRYTTDLKASGLTPVDKTMKFKYGFVNEFHPEGFDDPPELKEDPRRMTTDAFEGEKTEDANDIYSYTPEAKSIDIHAYNSACRSGCTATENGFEMMAIIPIDDTRQDVWLMNHNKELIHVKDGFATE